MHEARFIEHSKTPLKNFKNVYFAGDIGGTHSNLGILGERGKTLELLFEGIYPSKSIDGLQEPIETTLKKANQSLGAFEIKKACISGAGPVQNNNCHLSNLPWAINGSALETYFGIPLKVINDFLAISYGVDLLDLNNDQAITKLSKPKTQAEHSGAIRLVIGAGTGLGIGFVSGTGADFVGYPSEGAHSIFGPYDEASRELSEWLRKKKKNLFTEKEWLISGAGIANIFNFLALEKEPESQTRSIVKEILEAEDQEQPRLIGENAQKEGLCRRSLEWFIELSGKVSSELAQIFLSNGGVFLAGGVFQRYEKWFLEEDRFMKAFLEHPKENIANWLNPLPVYLIKNYSISLYGAAHAGRLLIK